MLTDDSLTESESLPHEPEISQDDGYLTALKDHDLCDEDLCAKTLQAIEQIRLFDIAAVERDATLHEVVLVAANTLLHFLDRICLLTSEEWCMTVALYLFPHLANIDFLSILFLHRSSCRAIAAQADMSTTVTAVVCWVDIVLAKLATFILVVSGGFASHLPLLDNSGLLGSRREDVAVHAATQLPERWESIIGVIGSNTASPAAIRLVTRLLFAVLVMGPQLNGEMQWPDFRIHPHNVMSAILRNADRKDINGLSMDIPGIEYDHNERVNLAMLMIIFSVSHTAQKHNLEQVYQPFAKIQTLGRLLDVLQVTFHYGDTDSCGHKTHPSVILDTAQTILIRWGNLVPWCWSAWGDQRIANAEYIVDLTITWLYHLNTPFCTNSSSECLAAFSFNFDSIILDEESQFGTIIVQILNRLMLHTVQTAQRQAPHDISADLAVVLRKMCSVTVQLLRYHTERWDASYERVVRSVCWSLQAIFCWLGGKTEDLNIKDLILEILSLIRPDVVISSFHTLCEDKRLQVGEKLDQDIVRFKEKIDLWNDKLLDVTATCLDVKYAVYFLALIWHNNLDGSISTSAVLSLVLKMMGLLLGEAYDSDRRLTPILHTAILTFASISSRSAASGAQNSTEEGSFWGLALHSDCTDFTIASALAHRILMTEDSNIELLDLAEAWDHLRDVLLVILSGCVAEEDETLALLICPGICMALTKLVQIDSFTTDFIVSSPWTTSLSAQLDSLISAENLSMKGYSLTLQQQLRRAGKTLLYQLAKKKLRLSGNTDIVKHHAKWRLAYYCTPTGSHLVLVPPE